MVKKTLRVMQAVVDETDRRKLGSRKARDRLFARLVDEAVAGRQRCDILLLPAGFWPVSSRRSVGSLVKKLAEQVAGKNLVVVGGADIVGGDKATKPTDGWPFWGFAVGGPDDLRCAWQQRSTATGNATSDNAICIAERTAKIRGHNVLILLCGEVHGLFNRKRAAGVQKTGDRVDLILNPSHTGAGGSVLKGIRSFAKAAGVPALRVEHRATPSGSFQRVTASGAPDQLPFSPTPLRAKDKGPWAHTCHFEM